VLEKIRYRTYNWYLFGHIRIFGMLLGQQGGHTKFPYFLREWDITARNIHWTTKDWPKRKYLIPESKNVVHASSVDNQKILLPPST
jgi:hypothetical protein